MLVLFINILELSGNAFDRIYSLLIMNVPEFSIEQAHARLQQSCILVVARSHDRARTMTPA